MMKNLTKFLTVVALVVLCVSLFTIQAFAATEIIKSVHDPVDATCEHPGYKGYIVCNSGRKYDVDDTSTLAPGAEYEPTDDPNPNAPSVDDSKPKLDHEGDAVDATCTEPGYFICKNGCGAKFVDPEKPATGHDLTETGPTTGADCTTNGNIRYFTCSKCNKCFDENGKELTAGQIWTGPKGAHTWPTEWTVETPATATHGGTEYRVCTVCGEKQTRTIPAIGVEANVDDLYYLIASRDTYYRGEELPSFWSDLIEKLNNASGPNANYVGVRIGTDKSLYANSFDTFDFWSSGNHITLGQKLVDSLDAGTYYIWVYNKNNPNEHTNSIPWYIVDTPTLEPINTDKHVVNSTKNLKFRASEPIQPGSVKVGGKTLYSDDYYYVSNDGMTITLSPDFLNERQPGTFTISANTVADGTRVSCPFYILSTAGASVSPKTGDESQIGLWAAFLLLSGAAIVVLVPKIRKHGA